MNQQLIDEAVDMFFTIIVVCASIGISLQKSQVILKAYAAQGLVTSLALLKFMELDSIPFYEENKERIRSLAPKAIEFITPLLTSDDIICLMKLSQEDIEEMKMEEAGEEHPLIKRANEIIRGENE